MLFTSFPYDWRLWEFDYLVFPGIKAMRAIARIGLLLLIPAGIAVASVVQHSPPKTRAGALVIVLALFCCLEQFGTTPGFDKVEVFAKSQALAARVDPEADAFLYLDQGSDWTAQQLDAMWAQQISGVRTVNVYSGSLPPGYLFGPDFLQQGPADRARAQETLGKWFQADQERLPKIQIILTESAKPGGTR